MAPTKTRKRTSQVSAPAHSATDFAAQEPPGRHREPLSGQARLHELRARHPRFHYEGFSRELRDDVLRVQYQFRLEPDIVFTPKLKIQGVGLARLAALPPEILENLLFHIGMVESFSYWKAAAPAEIVVHAAALDEEQVEWWLDLLRRGMGEFFYINRLDWRAPNFVSITNPASVRERAALSAAADSLEARTARTGSRDLVLASGGKDTVVTLQLLREAGTPFDCMLLNPTKAALAVAAEGGCTQPIVVRRMIDPKLLELNQEGYFNGHTPFSALLAFMATAVAALFGHGRVIVSNERSAEEPGVEYLGHPINHQYSKTFEFEKKFRAYSAKYLPVGDGYVEYFSVLRPLYELQIARRFARYPQYFQLFRSCNRGQADNSWCGHCPKCLFVYAVLGPFLDHGQLNSIFGTDLGKHSDNGEVLRTLLGMDRAKPFECVGTREETVAALFLTVKHFREQGIALPSALREINESVLESCTNLSEVAARVMHAWTDDHYVPAIFVDRLRD
jgi:UDP-N-acetyl-alpha-D-muramoyl-L-alanyl-L-glutamate epimerase